MVHLRKRFADERLGISFAPMDCGNDAVVHVTALHPLGEAFAAGMRLTDRVLSINGEPVKSALDAARSLREVVGDLCLCIERPLCASASDEACESPLRKPRIGRQPSTGFDMIGIGAFPPVVPKLSQLLPDLQTLLCTWPLQPKWTTCSLTLV